MSHLTNYMPYWCDMDQFSDNEWGCGWRSLQILMSQLGQVEDVMTLANNVKTFTGDEEIVIDFKDENVVISMADLSQLAPYFEDYLKKNGHVSANFDMLMINDVASAKTVCQRLHQHFNVNGKKNLCLIGSGGNVGLICGIDGEDEKSITYLIDPHSTGGNFNFNSLNVVGAGGQGWYPLWNFITYGHEQLGKSPTDYLEYSPAIVVIFNDVNL